MEKKTEKELLLALQKLDEDLLDPSLHEDAVDAELKAIGLDPATVAKRGAAFVFSLQEQKRLSWKETEVEECYEINWEETPMVELSNEEWFEAGE